MFKSHTCLYVPALCLALSFAAAAQSSAPAEDAKPADQAAVAQPAPPPPPGPLSAPAITGPLSNLPPANFEAGPFGKISVNGLLNGFGMAQNNHVPGDDSHQAALGNGQVFIQKTDGFLQFYVQAGAYQMPSLAVPFLATDKTMSNFFGPVPV